MGVYIIKGGENLTGEIRVQGSKNSSLPILAATILNGKKNTIIDVPKIKDLEVMTQILSYLGADTKKQGNVVEVDSENVNYAQGSRASHERNAVIDSSYGCYIR